MIYLQGRLFCVLSGVEKEGCDWLLSWIYTLSNYATLINHAYILSKYS